MNSNWGIKFGRREPVGVAEGGTEVWMKSKWSSGKSESERKQRGWACIPGRVVVEDGGCVFIVESAVAMEELGGRRT